MRLPEAAQSGLPASYERTFPLTKPSWHSFCSVSCMPKPAINRVLFYIPVVTPWWFEHIIFPLIQALSKAHEVHVMAPPHWRGTGLGAAQAPLIEQSSGVFWHLLDGPNHPQLRTDASGDAALLNFVAALAPDLTLCRSADIVTPARFPGVVKHLMEGAAPPFESAGNRIRLADTLFDYGPMPDFSCAEAAQLDEIGDTLWADQIEPLVQSLPSRAQFCNKAGLPQDRKIIALPLEYEHPENFFTQHLPFKDNAAMVTAIAALIPSDCVLAVTQHPLNELYADTVAVQSAIAAQDDRVVLLESSRSEGRRTLELSLHCDGMIAGNSKSWAPCAAFGNAVARLSSFQMGEWVNAYSAAQSMIADIRAGCARVPNQRLTRRWFAYHNANCVFGSRDPGLSAADITDHALIPHRPESWDQVIAQYRAQFSCKAAA